MPGAAVSTILLATDLSARCDRAAERTVALAEEWGAKLHVLTVLDPAGSVEDAGGAEAASADARRRALAAVKGHANSEIHVLVGSPDASIAALAQEVNADLIVTGPSGGRWLDLTVLGGTVKSLMRSARVPVLLVRAPVVRGYRRVIVSMDLSDASRAPVEAALRLFARSASLSVFHAFSTPFRLFTDDIEAYEAGVREGVTLEIREALRAWPVPDADTLPVIALYGDPAPELSKLVERHDIDVIVTGTHGRTGLMSVMLGSVAEAIVETVTCDVLIAPSRGAWPD